MASSIGSPSFIVRAAREKNSVLSHIRRPRFHCYSSSSSSSSIGRSFLGCGLLKVENGDQILRAIGKSSGGKDGGDDSNVDEAEDRIQAAINESKKVIALQKELLQQVTKYEDAPQSEWKNWNWKSEGDLLLNGAFFTPSGASASSSYAKASSLGAKSSSLVGPITTNAGALNCRKGCRC